MRVGLVLGAGGAGGLAFHAAALTALELDLGWDPRDADVVVGTSAGSLAATMLSLGVPGSDMAALISEVPERADHALISEGIAPRPELPPARWSDLIPLPGADIGRYGASLSHLLRARPVSAWISLLGAGRVDFRPYVAFIDEQIGDEWPATDVRICAVRATDHSLVVWDSESRVSMSEAVSSSCSVPGYARAVPIHDACYVDGGVRSPTNADVLSGDDLDLVIVASPMTPICRPSLGPGRLVADWAERRLRREVAALRGSGKEVVVLRSPLTVARAATSATEIGARQAKGIVGEGLVTVGEQLGGLRGRLGDRSVDVA